MSSRRSRSDFAGSLVTCSCPKSCASTAQCQTSRCHPKASSTIRRRHPHWGSETNVVRGLVLQGVFTATAGYWNGYSKLVPARQVRRFAERYVAATVIAKYFNLNGQSFAHYLRESGTPLLAVSIPDEGKGQNSSFKRTPQCMLSTAPSKRVAMVMDRLRRAVQQVSVRLLPFALDIQLPL